MADATISQLEAIDEATAVRQSRPPLEVLHDWVTTVDHKKIGLMYIAYALIFLVIAGFEAVLMRIQLAVPNNTFLSPQVFNRCSPCMARRWSSSSACRFSSASAII